jgi:hypothetical protein
MHIIWHLAYAIITRNLKATSECQLLQKFSPLHMEGERTHNPLIVLTYEITTSSMHLDKNDIDWSNELHNLDCTTSPRSWRVALSFLAPTPLQHLNSQKKNWLNRLISISLTHNHRAHHILLLISTTSSQTWAASSIHRDHKTRDERTLSDEGVTDIIGKRYPA